MAVADEFGVGEVECGAVEVGRGVDRVAVAPPELFYESGGAQHRGDFHAVVASAAGRQSISEGAPYVVE